MKEEMFKAILKTCKNKQSKPWTLEELQKVLSSLKTDTCRDPYGLVKELFVTNVAEKTFRNPCLYFSMGLKNQTLYLHS